MYTYDPSYYGSFKATEYIRRPYLNEYISVTITGFLAMSSFTWKPGCCLCCSDSKVHFAELTNKWSSHRLRLQAWVRTDDLSRGSSGQSCRTPHPTRQRPSVTFPMQNPEEAQVRMGGITAHLSRT